MAYRLPLSATEFRDALWRGLGRAMQHVRAHGDAGIEEVLREACARNIARDIQIDGTRADWLLEIIDHARDPLSYAATTVAALDEALSREAEWWELPPLWAKVAGFAKRGDAESILRVARIPPEEVAEEPAQPWKSTPRARETLETVLERIESEPRLSPMRFSGWARKATPTESQELFRRLLAETRPMQLARLLGCFTSKENALPRLDPRVLDALDHLDATVRRTARMALSVVNHPEARRIALTELTKDHGEHRGIAIDMLSTNWKPGDEALVHAILSGMNDPGDPEYIHSSVASLIKSRPNDEALDPLALSLYGATACSVCRCRVITPMIARGAAPAWLLEEIADDACGDVRALAQN